MLKCREVVHDTDLLLAQELSWHRRLSLRLHLMMCHHCRRYVTQLRRLLKAAPLLHRKASPEEVDRVIRAVHESGASPPPTDTRPETQ